MECLLHKTLLSEVSDKIHAIADCTVKSTFESHAVSECVVKLKLEVMP